MAERSRCQGWTLGERRESVMGVLREAPRLEQSSEQLAEELLELLLPVRREVCPQGRRAHRQGGGVQARGGLRCARTCGSSGCRGEALSAPRRQFKQRGRGNDRGWDQDGPNVRLRCSLRGPCPR